MTTSFFRGIQTPPAPSPLSSSDLSAIDIAPNIRLWCIDDKEDDCIDLLMHWIELLRQSLVNIIIEEIALFPSSDINREGGGYWGNDDEEDDNCIDASIELL